jgi:hypothetical protein
LREQIALLQSHEEIRDCFSLYSEVVHDDISGIKKLYLDRQGGLEMLNILRATLAAVYENRGFHAGWFWLGIVSQDGHSSCCEVEED